MDGYVANGNMYGSSRAYSSPFSNMHTEPFKTAVNELYDFMLQRLSTIKEYEDTNAPIEFTLLRHMQREMHAYNPLSVILDNDAYYFSAAGIIRRIDKYESN
jgi:hypothetical protein